MFSVKGWILGAAFMVMPGMVHAGVLEKLVMPGPLIKNHAKLEDECTKCHTFFKKETQNKKCVDCHKDVGQDLKDKTGFHGRSKGLATMKCKHCHTDHIGRDADIVQLEADLFDHRVTDFVLKGAHQKVLCGGCHLPKKKFREAASTCFACHQSDDPHFKRLGKDCAKCHTEKAWGQTLFDHGKQTKFPLKGKHRKVECNGCHPNQRYKNTPKTCVSCHRLNDVHRGNFGKKCETCHNPNDWKKISFNHDRDTKFPLKGRHAKVKCASCHSDDFYKRKLKTECAACHQSDDTHKGQFGRKCDKCHAPTQWKKVIFNHDKDTKFKLVDRHAKVDCLGCHKGNPYKEKLRTECYACHQKDDVHKGQEGKKCDRCHNQHAWGDKVKFNHDRTRFPLIGLHAVTACENCHLTASYKQAPDDCVDCHQKEDIHKKRLGDKCGLCHNPEGWRSWKFDHKVQTDFPLKGAHEKLQCHFCHTQPVQKKIELPALCGGCHKSDDVHQGQEGERCDQCHNERAWGDNIRFNHDLTRFPLIGLHAIASCESCHLSATFKNVASKCTECHKKEDVHKQTLGLRCEMCHNPNGWNLWRFDHNKQTEFILDGSHEGLECGACHTRPVRGKVKLAKTCFACHRTDDTHRGKYGRNCDRCHTTNSFKEVDIKH